MGIYINGRNMRGQGIAIYGGDALGRKADMSRRQGSISAKWDDGRT